MSHSLTAFLFTSNTSSQSIAKDKDLTSLLAKIYAPFLRPLYWIVFILAGGALTIDHGAAVIGLFVVLLACFILHVYLFFFFSLQSLTPIVGNPFLRFLEISIGYLRAIRMHLGTPEQKKVSEQSSPSCPLKHSLYYDEASTRV